MSDEILEQQEAPTADRDLFDEIEEEQDSSPSSEKPSKKPVKEPEEPQEESEEEQEDSEESKEKKPKKEKPEKLSKKDEESEIKDNKDDIEKEKLKKNLLETQKYATKKAQQSKLQTRHFEKTIQELVERGSLTEEEAQRALIKPDEDDIPFEVNEDLSELDQYFRDATLEFENLKRYSEDDESLEEKREAFNFLIATSSPEDIEEIKTKLRTFKGNSVALAKAMLKMGEEENNYLYKEIKSLGGIRSYIKYRDEIDESNKNDVAKLKKKLLQYEDYDKRPNYRLSDHSSHNKEEKSSYDDPFDDVKAKDSRPVKRR